MAKERIINWNDTGTMPSWGIGEFIAWHKGLVKHFGTKKIMLKNGKEGSVSLADYYLTIGWVGSQMPNSIAMKAVIAAPSQFKEEIGYFEKYPFLYETLQFKNIVKLGKYNPINLTVKAVETTVGIVDDIIDVVGGTVKILKIVVFVGLIGGAIVGGIYLYKKSGV